MPDVNILNSRYGQVGLVETTRYASTTFAGGSANLYMHLVVNTENGNVGMNCLGTASHQLLKIYIFY